MERPTEKEMQKALIARQGKERTEKFTARVVAVCGLGGLGSNIAIALARAGVGRLILIDFDRVEISNLNRQQYKVSQIGMYKTEACAKNLWEIAPYLRLTRYSCRITPENAARLLADADVVCEAFDGAEDKAMLTDIVLEQMPETYLVSASGMAGLGPAEDIVTRKVSDRFYVCGDETTDVADGAGLVSARVLLCAAHQALTALRILAGEE